MNKITTQDEIANAEPIAERATREYLRRWKHLKNFVWLYVDFDFIVYIDKDGFLTWQTTKNYDETVQSHPKYNQEQHDTILNEAEILDASACDDFTSYTRTQLRRSISNAMAAAFKHDYVGARAVLATAQEFLRVRSEELSRFWYLTACFGATAPLVVFGCAIWICREYFATILGARGLSLAFAIAAGGAGALLSVILRSGSLKFDCSAGRALHYLEGVSRICAGALSGVVVALAINSEIILATLTRGRLSHVVTVLAAMGAGASERLAGSIISKFEATEIKLGESGTARGANRLQQHKRASKQQA